MRMRKLLDITAAIGALNDIDVARRVFLEMLREVVWFDRGLFWLYEPLTGYPAGLPVSLDMPKTVIGRHLDYFAVDEARQAYRSSGLLILRSTELFTYSQWTQKSKFYNYFLRPFDLHYLTGYDIKVGKRIAGAVCLARGKKTGNFRLGDVNTLKLIYPHLQNRLRWHQIIHTAEKNSFTQNILPAVKDNNEQLTQREQEIVRLVMSGASNREIATLLGISLNTVKMHLQNVFDKLRIKRRSQLFLHLPPPIENR